MIPVHRIETPAKGGDADPGERSDPVLKGGNEAVRAGRRGIPPIEKGVYGDRNTCV